MLRQSMQTHKSDYYGLDLDCSPDVHVEGLVLSAAAFTGRAFGRCLAFEGADLDS